MDSSSILVDSLDSEQVLCIFEQPCDVAGQLLAFVMHDNPVEPVGVAPFHDVVGDLVATVLERRLPAQCARLFSDLADLDVAFTRSRGVC